MKKIFCLGSLLLLFLSVQANAQEKTTNIQIQITDENGKVIRKEYSSLEAMENDPEIKEMGVKVEAKGFFSIRNKEGIQQVSVTRQDGPNRMVIRQQGSAFGPDSMDMPVPPAPPQPPLGMEKVVEERLRMMEKHDSLLSLHLQEREAHMEEACLHREKMLIQMDNRREEMQARMEERRDEVHHRIEDSRKGLNKEAQMITIEHLSEKDAASMGIKQQNLQLQGLQISPKPMEESLQLAFTSKSKTPVQVKLSNQDNILLLNETENLSGKSFEKTYALEGFGRGTYILQIIQDNKIQARKIRVE